MNVSLDIHHSIVSFLANWEQIHNYETIFRVNLNKAPIWAILEINSWPLLHKYIPKYLNVKQIKLSAELSLSKTIIFLATHCKNLRYLELQFPYDISREQLLLLYRHNPELQIKGMELIEQVNKIPANIEIRMTIFLK